MKYKNGELDKSKENIKRLKIFIEKLKYLCKIKHLVRKQVNFSLEMIAKRKQLNRFSIERIGSKIIELTTDTGKKFLI